MKGRFKKTALKSLGIYINTLSRVYPKEAVRLAEKFISEPQKGKLTIDELPDILNQSIQQRIVSDKFSIQTYTWIGEKPNIILLVHGWESNSARWYKLIPVLQKSGYTILALDAPAHGLSDNKWFNVAKYSEAITEVIEHHNPEIVIGHSIGGTASIFHQYKHHTPSIQKIVTLGAPGELEIMVRNFASLLGLKKRVIPMIDRKFQKDYKFSFQSFSVAKMVQTITTSGLVVHDRNDIVVKIREGRQIAAAWKNASLIETKGLGHGLQNEELFIKIFDYLFPKTS